MLRPQASVSQETEGVPPGGRSVSLESTPIVAVTGAAEFKQAARRFASGVTIVTTRSGDRVYGLTVSAFSSLSIDPLQVLVSIRNGNHLGPMVLESKVFAVSILREGQRALSDYFATSGRPPSEGSFPNVPTLSVVTGSPVISEALAYFDCSLSAAYPGGDHTILVGDVLGAGASEGAPLLYFDGAYRSVQDLINNQ